MDERLKQIQKLLDAAEGNLHSARNLMRDLVSGDASPLINVGEKAKDLNVIEEGKIIEGVYNGENMVGPDGKEYPVPANYASKSKLVEGDVLKLTIADDGSFIYKQIKPIERRKAIGTLVYDGGNYTVTAEGKTYKVLQASVTYYKGDPGDQVTIILPKEHESNWAAVENIIKGAPDQVASTDQSADEPVTETELAPEETENGPEIEFPAEPGLNQDDKAILDNLAQNTVPNTPEEMPEELETPPTDDEKDTPPSGGIKELEI